MEEGIKETDDCKEYWHEEEVVQEYVQSFKKGEYEQVIHEKGEGKCQGRDMPDFKRIEQGSEFKRAE